MTAAQLGLAARRREEDADSRRRAQLQFDAPLVIEAGAGTGKTATLVARVLAWCLGPGWERARDAEADADALRTAERVLRRVVAITFTEAAAAEMDARIESALAELECGERPVGFDMHAPPDRVQALRGALDHLSVQTIHAWCRRLLSDHPLEAGVHPLFEVDADGAAREAAIREVAGLRLGEGYAARDPALLALAERGVGPGEIERALAVQLAAGVRSEELAADPLAPDRVEALRARLAAAHEALERAGAGALGSAKGTRRGAAVESSLARGQALLAGPVADPPALAALCQALCAAWAGTARNALESWKKPGGFGNAEIDAFAERGPAIADAASALSALLKHIESLDPEALGWIAPVLATLGAEVEERLRRSGQLGFDALLSRTAALLARPDVVGRVRAGIDQLLVDEFQDTDPRQCAIVAALALDGPADERPGLFLVGDPKQSIYGWRSADLEAYEGLVARAIAAGGREAPLCVNHRSVPTVLEAVERVVSPVMLRERGLQPAFQGLAPSEEREGEPGFSAAGRAPVEIWIPTRCDADGTPQQTRGSEAAELEARALASDLRALHDGEGVAWQDVGLLFRSRGEWDVYLGALREADIPYRVEGDRSYYRRREILDAASLVCAVLDPTDVLALVALLRSSAAGVPDAAWIPLWEGGLPGLAAHLGEGEGDEEVLAALRGLLGRAAAGIDPSLPGMAGIEGWADAVGACLETVAALRRSFHREAGDRFVERLRALTAFEGVEAGRFLGRWRSANLERFFSGCAESLGAAGSPDAVLRALRRAVAEEELPSVEPAVLDAGDAVSVVTLHGAKGLAWDHVYLMQLHKAESNQAPRDEAGRIDERLEARWCGWPTLGCDAWSRRRERVAEAERVRTLYVGMTRAKRRLVMSGLWPALMSGGTDTHTALLAAGAGAAVDLAQLAGAADEAGRVQQAGWSWRFVDRAERAPDAREMAERQTRPSFAPAGAGASSPPPSAVAGWAAPMARRRIASVTSLAVPTEAEASAQEPHAALGARAALRIGTAIHASLERLDLTGAREQAWLVQRESLEAELRGAADERALHEALALWDALAAGSVADRLAELAPRIVARELTLLLPLDGDAEAGARAEHASGSIDLLYRDPDGRLVVADYKTDRRDGSPSTDDVAGTRACYARQGALYCRAVAGALGADPPPRFELWWLRTGEVERMS